MTTPLTRIALVFYSITCIPALTWAAEHCANAQQVDAKEVRQYTGLEALHVRLGPVEAGSYIKVQQRYVDVAWQAHTEHWQSEVIDSALGVFGSEVGLVERSGVTWLCIWGQLANPGELRVELVPDDKPGLAERAKADVQNGTIEQRRAPKTQIMCLRARDYALMVVDQTRSQRRPEIADKYSQITTPDNVFFDDEAYVMRKYSITTLPTIAKIEHGKYVASQNAALPSDC